MNPDEGLHSDETERSLLGCIMIDPSDMILDAFIGVPAEAYWLDRNRTIAKRIRAMIDMNDDVDIVTVTEALRKHGELEQVGSVAYVIGCSTELPATTEHAVTYARTLVDLYRRRRLAVFSGETLLLARDQTKTLDEVYGSVETKLTTVTRNADAGPNVDDHYQRALDALDDTGGTYFQTGLDPFDRLVGGLKGFVVIGARPSMGKSSLIRDVLRHQRSLGKRVALFTQDQIGSDAMSFEASIRAHVSFHKIRARTATPEQRDLWRTALRELRDEYRDSYVIDERPHNVHALVSRIRAAARWGADLIGVDYLQLIDVPAVKDGNQVTSTTIVSKALKHLTQELGIPILTLAQLNRGVEARRDKRPMLSDLRESGQIEQDAETVVFLYRPEYYTARDEGRSEQYESDADLIVAKNKTGPSGTARVIFNSEYATFRAHGTAPVI